MQSNERFPYIKSDFLHENLTIRRTPKSSVEAFNKLVCLAENNCRRNPHYKPFEYSCINRSKRYNRILKMYWAYYKAEKRENLQYILEG